MKKLETVLPVLGSLLLFSSCDEGKCEKPNIVFIIADDIGYGDFGCYGAESIKTPNIDSIASKGVRFTNAYSPASTSSPTRYALLTGEYAWRSEVGILSGDAPLSIDTARNTLPKQMKHEGYTTAIVGKWHLGLGSKEQPVDFNDSITAGMKGVGFDYSFIFPATNDRVPTIYIENDRTVGLDPNDPIRVDYNKKIGDEPTGKENPELLTLKHYQGHDGTIINGIGRMGWTAGGKATRWRDEMMSAELVDKAISVIENREEGKPFFLYYAAHNAHEPRVASEQFKGRSAAGPYGDVIEEFDYCVGKVISSLKREGILDNTIIIITSDNGPMIKEGYEDGALENIGSHDPFGGLRGTKYTLLEGGTRVPFIAYWGDKIKTPFEQKQRFCYIDMLATLASITGDGDVDQQQLADSRDASQLFFTEDAPVYRPYILTQNNPGNIALRIGDWKYIPRVGNWPAQLYNLAEDHAEKSNLATDETYSDLVNKFENEIKLLRE